MAKLYVLIVIALRNLVSHRAKTLIVGLVMGFGTFLLVLGTSLLGSIEYSMEKAITASLTGDLQVWSADSEDDLSLFGSEAGGMSNNDIGEFDSFEDVEKTLLELAEVKAVVPMATGLATSFGRSDIDTALETLDQGVDDGDAASIDQAREQIEMIAELLIDEFTNEMSVSSDPESWQEKLDIANNVKSDRFWKTFNDDQEDGMLYLESKLAPMSPEGQFLFVRYLATDPTQFAQTFDRFQIADGEMIPEGRRGLMITKRYYETGIKHKIARELDWLKEEREDEKTITEDAVLQSRIKQMGKQWPKIVFQLNRSDAEALEKKLRDYLQEEGELRDLVQSFLKVSESNFDERYAWFYEHIAPLLELYAVKPGDVITLQSFTKTGYFKSVNVRFYGTFNFRGLETSDLTQAMNVLDLVTFRELYGKMTAEQKEELKSIQEEIGIDNVENGEDIEDALFGGDESLVSDADGSELEGQIPDQLERAKSIDDRQYSRAEMRSGLALHAAVVLKEGMDLNQSIATIRNLKVDGEPYLKATDWQTAAGMIGQFVLVISLVLYASIFIIFMVALVILNNAMLMAMMERVGEIGTIRAMGGQRREIMLMVLIETLVLSIFAGILGGGFAVVVITILNSVGIPATTDVMVFLFGGPRLYPFVTFSNVLVAFVVILIVSLLSTLYPARIATKVQPVVAMQGN